MKIWRRGLDDLRMHMTEECRFPTLFRLVGTHLGLFGITFRNKEIYRERVTKRGHCAKANRGMECGVGGSAGSR